MFLGGRKLAEFELWHGKPKTTRLVMNINTIVTGIKEDHLQSVQALVIELKISGESAMCAAPPLFATHKNSCFVGAGTTHATKPAVSRLQPEIECLSCACSIDNEPQNTLFFFIFSIDALHVCTAIGSITLYQPLYLKLMDFRTVKLEQKMIQKIGL